MQQTIKLLIYSNLINEYKTYVSIIFTLSKILKSYCKYYYFDTSKIYILQFIF